jgi:hypothetical protein
MTYETKFLVSLAVTEIIEIPLAVIIIKYLLKLRGVFVSKIIITAFFASAFTLPYLWFVLPPFIDARLYIIYGESLVILVEALIYNQFLNIKIKNAILISLAANLISYFLGTVILK